MNISVVIANRNRINQLKVALPSIMAQQGVMEVLVGDDGSTDGSREWLEEQPGIKLQTYNRRKYILNPKAYHNLIAAAQGDIIIFSGGEMACPDPTGVRRLAARCAEKTIALARVYNLESPFGGVPSEDWVVEPKPKFWRLHGHDNIIYSGPERPAPLMFFAAFPKSIWTSTGGYSKRRRRGVDTYFARVAIKAGITFQGVGDVLAYHLHHPKF